MTTKKAGMTTLRDDLILRSRLKILFGRRLEGRGLLADEEIKHATRSSLQLHNRPYHGTIALALLSFFNRLNLIHKIKFLGGD